MVTDGNPIARGSRFTTFSGYSLRSASGRGVSKGLEKTSPGAYLPVGDRLFLTGLHEVQTTEEQQIRESILTWISATTEGAIGLCVRTYGGGCRSSFRQASRPPPRDAFESASRRGGKMRFEGQPDIQEIHVAGRMLRFAGRAFTRPRRPGMKGCRFDWKWAMFYRSFARNKTVDGGCFAMCQHACAGVNLVLIDYRGKMLRE